MPILKQLVLSPSGSKRRSRADLTVEMISAPLTDVRHTMHIGRSGDAFGDTSFLSAPHQSANQAQKNGILSRRHRSSKRFQAERTYSCMLPANSTISLPHARDQDVMRCLPQRTSGNRPETDRSSAVIGGWRLEENDQRFGNPDKLPMFTPPPSRGMKQTESMLSFHIDLGPSMLGDVLGVMTKCEQPQQELREDHTQDGKLQCPLRSVSTSAPGLRSETCSAVYNVNINDFLFMDEDEDEIRL